MTELKNELLDFLKWYHKTKYESEFDTNENIIDNYLTNYKNTTIISEEESIFDPEPDIVVVKSDNYFLKMCEEHEKEAMKFIMSLPDPMKKKEIKKEDIDDDFWN
ncbi:hypothetical protein M0Q50_02655 [bacterium]|jgi:hypothetical protein|nr:hypothetical protein [bacterium]